MPKNSFWHHGAADALWHSLCTSGGIYTVWADHGLTPGRSPPGVAAPDRSHPRPSLALRLQKSGTVRLCYRGNVSAARAYPNPDRRV